MEKFDCQYCDLVLALKQELKYMTRIFFNDAFEKGWRVTRNEDAPGKMYKKHRGDAWRVDKKTSRRGAWRVYQIRC